MTDSWIQILGRERWSCALCGQTVDGAGPWCRLYVNSETGLCRPMTVANLKAADARGDGALVNGLCAYGRAKWGPSLFW